MRIGILGINHKSGDLAYREMLAKACYKQLHGDGLHAKQLACVVLSTCHRTEIYFSAEDLAVAHSAILHALRDEIPFAFEHKLYAYFGRDCFAHLAQVTAGLDSMILAESEIQRQVKHAYEQACLHYSLPSSMHYLFQKSLRLGKYLRSHFALPRGQMTLSKTVYEICTHLFVDVKKTRTLFIGNSEINRKILTHFKHKGLKKPVLCTRSPLSAREMALESDVEIVDWSHLPQWGTYDCVISGTNTSSFLIHPIKWIVQTRLIFDLGVPRNINPAFSRDPHITLFNIDELGAIMEKQQVNHSEVLKEAEEIIEKKVGYYTTSFNEKRIPLCV